MPSEVDADGRCLFPALVDSEQQEPTGTAGRNSQLTDAVRQQCPFAGDGAPFGEDGKTAEGRIKRLDPANGGVNPLFSQKPVTLGVNGLTGGGG